MVYVPSIDAYLVRKRAAGAAVYRINAGTFAVDMLPMTGGGSIPESQNGVYTRWQYVPALGGVVYVPAYNSPAWFFLINVAATTEKFPLWLCRLYWFLRGLLSRLLGV